MQQPDYRSVACRSDQANQQVKADKPGKAVAASCLQPIENNFSAEKAALQAIEKNDCLGSFANCTLAITLEIIQMWSYL